MKKIIAALALFAGFALPAAADTLTLTSVTGTVVNGVYVYPYNFTANIGGTTSQMSLMCMDFNHEVTIGETWKVSETSIPTGTTTLAVNYQALALLFWAATTNYGGISQADYQMAAWSIFDPTDMQKNSAMSSLDWYISSTAVQTVLAGNLPTGFSYANFALYLPTQDSTGWTAGVPQRFVGYSTPNLAATPEPSSLLLLGTGMLVAGFVVMRRRKDVLTTA